MTVEFIPSRFNFHVPSQEGPLLYNSATGAVIALNGADADFLAILLTEPKSSLDLAKVISDSTLADLHVGGFLVPFDKDEVADIRQRYWTAREDTPVVLTLTTTLDCNLGCYYCYEDRSSDALALTDVESIVLLAASRTKNRKALHIDWYGGEPLMNIEFIEVASGRLQSYCKAQGVRYSASIISNGTCWPDDVSAFIIRHCIRQVQISFDGLKQNHERRRRFRSNHSKPKDSSFDLALSLVDKLVDHVRVDIRFNIDRGNAKDLLPFVRFAQERGWFDGRYPATLQPARLSAYSDRSSFMRKSELTVQEFDSLRSQVRGLVNGIVSVDESESPEGFPKPRASVCAALANDSVVVGADRRLYRCGLQVSEPSRSTGDS